MVKIRLQRVGAKKKPAYRIVVADSRSPRDGAFIEVIGHYDPLSDPPAIVIKQEKAVEWLRRGAQPTQTVASLLNRSGITDKLVGVSLRKPTDRKTPKKSEKKAAAAQAKAAPAPAKAAPAPESKPAAAAEGKPAEAAESKAPKASEAKPAAAAEGKAPKASEAKPAAAESKAPKASKAKPAAADSKPAASS